MKAVVQRVLDASVTVGGEARGSIGFGLLVYVGVAAGDTETDAGYLAEKTANLRIFDDSEGKMNLSLLDIVNLENSKVNNGNPGTDTVNRQKMIVNDTSNSTICGVFSGRNPAKTGVLAVSQFTLLGDARKGRRPSWAHAAPPETAKQLYGYFMAKIRERGIVCESGEFQAHMQVTYTNDGPVTILLDSRE